MLLTYLIGLALLAAVAYALGRHDGRQIGIRRGIAAMRATYARELARIDAAGDE